MKVLILFSVLISLVLSQQITSINIPADYSSSFTFHYKGGIYAILDVYSSNSSSNSRIGQLSNGQWSRFLDLPNKCTSFPCSTSTQDFAIIKNTLYVSVGTYGRIEKTIAAINLDTFTITLSHKTPKYRIDGAFFIPVSDSTMVYMWYRQGFGQFWSGAIISLPSLQWSDWEAQLSMQELSLGVPFDANNVIVCNYGFCALYNIESGAEKDLASGVGCSFGHYLRSSNSIFCSQFDYYANSTVLTTYSLSATSIDVITNGTIGSYEEMVQFSSVDEKLNIAYIITAIWMNDQPAQYTLYKFNYATFTQISRQQLQLGRNTLNRNVQFISSEGDGILAITTRPYEFDTVLPSEVFLISV